MTRCELIEFLETAGQLLRDGESFSESVLALGPDGITDAVRELPSAEIAMLEEACDAVLRERSVR